MKNKLFLIIIIIIIAISGICVYLFLNEVFNAQIEIQEYDDLAELYTSVDYDNSNNSDSDNNFTKLDIYPPNLIDIDFNSLLNVNKDTVGWIKIPNTIIDYPVVQTTDNLKYLKTSFKGNGSGAGAIFVDCKNTIDPLMENTIIYGHNMGKGRTDMFGTLLEYKEKDYYPDHKYIQFDTIFQKYGYWEIFAVLHINANNKDFKYLTNIFENYDDYEIWLNKAKNLSLYDTGVDVGVDDKIITLSTCDRSDYGRDGRLVIMAKLVNSVE